MNKDFSDKLEIFYDELHDCNPKEVMTIARGDDALWMFHGEKARYIYDLILGNAVPDDFLRALKRNKS